MNSIALACTAVLGLLLFAPGLATSSKSESFCRGQLGGSRLFTPPGLGASTR